VNRAGGPVRNHGFAPRVWRPAVLRAEPKIHKTPRIHDLRHTCASWLIAAGIPLPVIQQQLGHESIQTTVDRYGHLDRRSAQAASDVMAALLATTPAHSLD
jgi:integrase